MGKKLFLRTLIIRSTNQCYHVVVAAHWYQTIFSSSFTEL